MRAKFVVERWIGTMKVTMALSGSAASAQMQRRTR